MGAAFVPLEAAVVPLGAAVVPLEAAVVPLEGIALVLEMLVVLFRCTDDVTKADVAVAFDLVVLETVLNGETAFVIFGGGPMGAGVGSMCVPFT